jgi:hypothetical protein
VKGRINAYDPATFWGQIQGHDGEQYDFARSDWSESAEPEAGKSVDFQIEDLRARNICFDDRVMEIVGKYPGPVTLRYGYAKRFAWGALALFVGVIAYYGFVDVVFSQKEPWTLRGFAGLLGLVFAYATVEAGWRALSNEAAATLDRHGITARTGPFDREYAAWDASLLTDDAEAPVAGVIKDLKLFGMSKNDAKRLITRWCHLALTEPKAARPNNG